MIVAVMAAIVIITLVALAFPVTVAALVGVIVGVIGDDSSEILNRS